MVDNSAPLIAWASSPGKLHIPDLARLQSVPMIGDRLYTSYHTLVNAGGAALLAKVQPYFGQTATVRGTGGAYRPSAAALRADVAVQRIAVCARRAGGTGYPPLCGAPRFCARRCGGAVGRRAIRAVALGVVVTALVQSVLGGIGLAVSGIPAATLLTMLIFICCVAQLGPLLVLVPAIIWLYWHGDTTGAPCCWSGAAW